MHNPLDSFSYHINWKSRGHHPGQHKSGKEEWGWSLQAIQIY